MRSKKHTILFVSILAIFHSVLCCNFNSRYERAHCFSLNALKRAGQHHEWKKLNVINPGSEPFSPIKQGTFNGYPNVIDLQVKGIANEIQPNAWDGLNNLYELHLDDNKINVIPSDAFSQLPCTVLFIYFCDVQVLMPKAFNNIPKLRKVNIYGNNISIIRQGVFSETGISHLIMRKNYIKLVEPNAFNDMDNLIHLSLEENELISFVPQLSIGYAHKLTHLYINRNKLTNINKEMFAVMPNLQILSININQIERIGDNTFTNLTKLRTLDISNNRLGELQTNLFSSGGHASLNLLFLHDNRLSFLSTGVLIRLPNLRKISVGGNPWQCPCWKSLDHYILNHNIIKVCDDLYKAGKRPRCVYSENSPRDCIYDVENVRDLPDLFEELLKEYGKLPPVCNIDNRQKSTLGA